MNVYVDYTTNELKVRVGIEEERLTEHQAKLVILNLIKGLQELAVARHAL
jgi:hypothetical protein